MVDHGVRAARRAARRNGPVENVALDIAGNVDNQIDVEEVVRAPHERVRPPAVIAPLTMDPGLWLNIVNVKPPYSLDLEIDSMKKVYSEVQEIFSEEAPDNFYARCMHRCIQELSKTWMILFEKNNSAKSYLLIAILKN